jgi:hypothetical protein
MLEIEAMIQEDDLRHKETPQFIGAHVTVVPNLLRK